MIVLFMLVHLMVVQWEVMIISTDNNPTNSTTTSIEEPICLSIQACKMTLCGKVTLADDHLQLRQACNACNESVDFVCLMSKKCILRRWLCDGENDCEDSSDEANCSRPPSGSCGITETMHLEQPARRKRLFDGTVAALKEIPWQAFLEGRKESNSNSVQSCGAVIIAENLLLTAAHCCDKMDPKLTEAMIGFVDFENPNLIRNISQFVIHSNYKPNSFDYDFCLVYLDSPVSFSSWTVQPICWPTELECQGEVCSSGQIAEISGWGKTSDFKNETSDVLLKGTVKIENSTECAEHNAGWYWNVTDRMLCAGGLADAAQGDSGGPLTTSWNNRRYLCGLSSWGRTGAKSPVMRFGEQYHSGYGYSSVYARICSVLPWINNGLNV